MNVYAFDVDHTLEVSAGPVTLDALMQLRAEGHIVGLCGNWGLIALRVPGWHRLFSFVGPLAMTKADFLAQIKTYVRVAGDGGPVGDWVMVGNDPLIYGASEDKVQAALAGWRFLREEEFAGGRR